MSEDRKDAVTLIVAILFVLGYLIVSLVVFPVSAKADTYTDTMISFLCREMDKRDAVIIRLEETVGELVKEVAELKGWMLGAVGGPLAGGLGGGGFWFWRRKKRKK